MAAEAITVRVRDEIRSEEYEVNPLVLNKVNVRAGDAFPVRPVVRESRSAAKPRKPTKIAATIKSGMSDDYSFEVYIQPAGGKRGIAYRESLKEPRVREYIRLTKDTIKERIRPLALGVCQATVSPGYVVRAIADNSILIMMKRGNRVIGFVLAKPTRDGGHYLDVICSAAAERKGRDLLLYFLRLAEEQGTRYVELSSLPTVLSYYPQFGFEHRHRCDTGKETIRMPNELLDWIKKSKPTEEQLFNNEEFLAFLDVLRAFGYTADKDDFCQSNDVDFNDYMDEECFGSGYTMRKCYVASPNGPTTRAKTMKAKAKREARKWLCNVHRNVHRNVHKKTKKAKRSHGR